MLSKDRVFAVGSESPKLVLTFDQSGRTFAVGYAPRSRLTIPKSDREVCCRRVPVASSAGVPSLLSDPPTANAVPLLTCGGSVTIFV